MIPSTLPEQIADLHRRVSEVERRSRNQRRTGVVSEIDKENGKYRIKLSELNGKPFLTPWIRTKQLAAGDLKVDILLKSGEQVDVISENGDGSDWQIDLSTYSNENNRKNTDTPYLITIGDVSFAIEDGKITQAAGRIELRGEVYIYGNIFCNGVEIGDKHKHDKTMPGGGYSGNPV